MKRKVATILDEDVIRRAKLVAAAEGRSLAEVVEESLRRYLAQRQTTGSSAVMETAGLIKATRSQVRRVPDLDPYER